MTANLVLELDSISLKSAHSTIGIVIDGVKF